MAMAKSRGFVTGDESKVERMPWGPYEWLSRGDIVDTKQILMARVRLRKGRGHDFHRHPNMEEVVYVLEGKAEQWIGEEVRVLGPGDVAHIPMDVVHATFNAGAGGLRYLMVLGPARFKGPALVDVSAEEPWCSIRNRDDGADRKACASGAAEAVFPGRRLSRATSSGKTTHSRRGKSGSSRGGSSRGKAATTRKARGGKGNRKRK